MELREISLSRDGIELIHGGSLPLSPGRVTVLFGPSGSGKSTLLYALADLDPAVSCRFSSETGGLRETAVGLVPQNSAIFEDLKRAGRNIAFAHAHSPGRGREKPVSEVLEEAEKRLGVRADWKLPLSGGQKQRIAIARALAGRAEVLLCDEPTSGLDPISRADAIRTLRAVAETGVAVLVVTHDLEWNRPGAADFAVVLRGGFLEPHPVGEPLGKHLFEGKNESVSANSVSVLTRFFRKTGESFWWFSLLAVQIGRGFFSRERIRWRWFLWYLIHYGRLVLGISSVVYLLIAGLLIGFSSFFFTVGALDPSPHLQGILVPELLSGSAFGLYRVIVPLISALLVAAKCGSAMAADFGSRQYGGQIAVMRTLRANPESYLLFSSILALAFGLPVLNFLAFGAAAIGSLAAWLYTFPVETAQSWSAEFFRLIKEPDRLRFFGTGWNLLKLSLSGAGIAVISYRFGTLPKSGNTEIGSDISRATLWSSLWCLVIFTLFAFYEF